MTVTNKSAYIAALRAESTRLLDDANDLCEVAARLAMEIQELEEEGMIPEQPYAIMTCPRCFRETPLTLRQFEALFTQSYTCFGCGIPYEVKGHARCVR